MGVMTNLVIKPHGDTGDDLTSVRPLRMGRVLISGPLVPVAGRWGTTWRRSGRLASRGWNSCGMWSSRRRTRACSVR
jgi:hypothetical protein